MDKTLNFFLIGMGFCYMFAFSSIYIQIPGLYGNNGLLPIKNFLKESYNYKDIFEKPTLVWFSKNLGLGYAHCTELLAFLGMIISFLVCISPVCRCSIIYFFLWGLYFSIYQVGQTFLWFQWDILLLESGFLTIIVAPLFGVKNLEFEFKKIPRKQRPNSNHWNSGAAQDATTKLRFWLIKWLCFRLMFASGLVKLTSKCPIWWGLEAMNWHYESQCIPTPMAWYAHHLPSWFQRFSVVVTLLIESALPLLFFSIMRFHRIFAAYAQVFLMFLILITGNFNFFNIHIIILHLCFADDRHFGYKTKRIGQDSFIVNKLSSLFNFTINIGIISFLVYYCIQLFGLKLDMQNFGIASSINFSQPEFFKWLAWIMPVTIWLATLSLAFQIIETYRSILMDKMFKKSRPFEKLVKIFKTTFIANIVIYLFVVSVVPYYDLDYQNGQKYLWPIAKNWFSKVKEFQIANSYGLFRSMTGVGGRPELVIMGSDHLDKGWKEIDFMYKVGDIRKTPPYLIPHQPRLDWQMWFAALDTYHYNPWLINLLYKILTHEKDVMALMGPQTNFKDRAPKYIKVDSYLYHYTKLADNTTNWWWREKSHEYFPAMSKDSPDFIEFLHRLNFETKPSPKDSLSQNAKLTNFILWVRQYIIGNFSQPHYFIWSISATALLINFI